MDRWTKLASKLYPLWWRKRYGEEFAALLEDSRLGLGGTLDVLKGALTMQLSTFSAKRILAIGAIVGLAIGFTATFFLTPEFSSSATISVRPAGKTTSVDIVDSISLLSKTVLSRPTMTSLIEGLNLYPQERAERPNEAIIEKVRSNIRISAAPGIGGGRAVSTFKIGFIYSDRVVAQKIVANLLSRLVDKNISSGGTTLDVLTIANLATEPMFPNRRNIALVGLGSGLLLGGTAALVLHLCRKRQPA